MSKFSRIFKAVAPIAALAIPGVGPIAAAGLKLYTQARTQTAGLLPAPGGIGGPANGGGFFPTAAAAGVVPRAMQMMRGMTGWLIGPRGIVTSATGKILGVMRGTSLFRNKKVFALAKQVGIDTAAVVLGVTVVEVAQMVFAHQQTLGRRRGRGISGRDVKVTRRTIGKIRTIEKSLAESGICAPRGRGRARNASGTFVRQG
jgi:hypothetical protein